MIIEPGTAIERPGEGGYFGHLTPAAGAQDEGSEPSAGWEKLLSIFELNLDEQRSWIGTPPQACPRDGEPLKTDTEGNLRCPADGWTWDGTPEGKRGTA